MKEEIIYRNAKISEFKDCLKFLLKYYKGYGLNQKSIDWEYSSNPFGKAKVFIALYKKKIVGMTTSIPLKFKKNDKIYSGFRTQDVLTDMNFRGMGIFSNLMRLNNKYLDQNSDINISFPNKNSISFFEKNNWRKICKIPFLSKTINNKANFKLNYSLINKFTNIHEDIWKENIGNKFDIMWNKDFSNWRYFLNPKSKYEIFEIKNNIKIIGYLVLKKYRLKNRVMMGHLCQLVCNNNYLQDNINFTINYFFELSIKALTLWRMNDENLFLKQLNFKKTMLPDIKFIYKSKKKLDKSKWNLSLSYSDVY